jgi:hypothetical protein
VADITEKDVKGDRGRVPLLLFNQFKMLPVLLPLPPVAFVPSEEHPTDCSISWVSGHPNFAIVIYLSRMIPVSVQGSTFTFTVSLLVNSVFIIPQMFTDIAPGESSAIW